MGSAENYHVIELVGEASFGKVYKGGCKHTGQTVAMKFIMKHGKTEKDIHNLRQEIEILRKLKHENIIQMLDSFESPQEFCVVTEFAQGELFEILEDDKCLPEEQVQAIAKQLVRALRYLHSNRIIHQSASLTTTSSLNREHPSPTHMLSSANSHQPSSLCHTQTHSIIPSPSQKATPPPPPTVGHHHFRSGIFSLIL